MEAYYAPTSLQVEHVEKQLLKINYQQRSLTNRKSMAVAKIVP